MPPSSLYCTQKSVSRISAAAANLSNAASPGVSRPLFSSGPSLALPGSSLASKPTPTVAAPAAIALLFKNERRLVCFCMDFGRTGRAIGPSLKAIVNEPPRVRRTPSDLIPQARELKQEQEVSQGCLSADIPLFPGD